MQLVQLGRGKMHQDAHSPVPNGTKKWVDTK